MSFLETFLSNSPVLSVINAAQSVCVTASVVAIGCPVHLCSLASCYNIDNLEDFQNNWVKTRYFSRQIFFFDFLIFLGLLVIEMRDIGIGSV